MLVIVPAPTADNFGVAIRVQIKAVNDFFSATARAVNLNLDDWEKRPPVFPDGIFGDRALATAEGVEVFPVDVLGHLLKVGHGEVGKFVSGKVCTHNAVHQLYEPVASGRAGIVVEVGIEGFAFLNKG